MGKQSLGSALLWFMNFFVFENQTVKPKFHFFVLENIWSSWSCGCLVVEPWFCCLLWFLETNLLNMFLKKANKIVLRELVH